MIEAEGRSSGCGSHKRGIYEVAEDENWVKAGWRISLHILNKTVVEVLADFLKIPPGMRIQDTHANGSDSWNFVKTHIDFVLSHPNRWEGTQQSELQYLWDSFPMTRMVIHVSQS